MPTRPRFFSPRHRCHQRRPRAPSPQAVPGNASSAKNANRSARFPAHRVHDRSTPRVPRAPDRFRPNRGPQPLPCPAPDFAAATPPSPSRLPAPPLVFPIPSSQLRTRESPVLALMCRRSFPRRKRPRQIKRPFFLRVLITKLQLCGAQFLLLSQRPFHTFANLPPCAFQLPRHSGLMLAHQPANFRQRQPLDIIV